MLLLSMPMGGTEGCKEEWIQKVASDTEAAVKDGKLGWNNIHRLLQVYGGCTPA